MKNKRTYINLWSDYSFRTGYWDGFLSYSFLVSSYKPKPVELPTVYAAWENVGCLLGSALAERSVYEEAETKKTNLKDRVNSG